MCCKLRAWQQQNSSEEQDLGTGEVFSLGWDILHIPEQAIISPTSSAPEAACLTNQQSSSVLWGDDRTCSLKDLRELAYCFRRLDHSPILNMSLTLSQPTPQSEDSQWRRFYSCIILKCCIWKSNWRCKNNFGKYLQLYVSLCLYLRTISGPHISSCSCSVSLPIPLSLIWTIFSHSEIHFHFHERVTSIRGSGE